MSDVARIDYESLRAARLKYRAAVVKAEKQRSDEFDWPRWALEQVPTASTVRFARKAIERVMSEEFERIRQQPRGAVDPYREALERIADRVPSDVRDGDNPALSAWEANRVAADALRQQPRGAV